MGASISSIFGVTADEPSNDYLQLTDLGSFLTKYVFLMLDKDRTKRISKDEYLTLVNHFRDKKTTKEELDEFLRKNVAEGAPIDYIDEVLFKKLIVQLALDFDQNVPDRMKYLMSLFDKDEDGFVSEDDLCGVYLKLGIHVPLEPIRCLVQKYDKDGDGKLSGKEFEDLGRSAMSKLFVKKEDVISDALVIEALRKGGESLTSPTESDSIFQFVEDNNNNLGGGEGRTVSAKSLEEKDAAVAKGMWEDENDINNNFLNGSSMFLSVDSGEILGSLNLLKLEGSSTSSSLFSDASDHLQKLMQREQVGNGGDSLSFQSLEGIMSELQLEDVED